MNGNDVKQNEVLPKEKSKVKSTLQQTYFISLLCMVLCVSMFLGTSYAWFTSNVTSPQNEIYIGILNVGLYKQEVVEQQTVWTDLSAENVKFFDSDNVYWEPGYTMLETVQVKNNGNLAFKYVLSFTDGTLADNSTQNLAEVAKYFDVWVYDHKENNNVAPEPTSFAEITDADSGWVPAGTLDQILTGKAVFKGAVNAAGESSQSTGATTPVTEATYTVALHMNENAVITLMGEKITLNVKLVAYQMTAEQDSLGSAYDQMAASEEELREYLEKGGLVTLVSDIMVTKDVIVPAGVIARLDLNGHTITRVVEEGANTITNHGTLTVYDSAEGGEVAMVYDGVSATGKAANAIANYGILTVEGGKYSNISYGLHKQIGYAIDNYNGAILTVNGGEIVASGSSRYDGIRLFCGENETLVTVNGGTISTIWAQNPSDNEAAPVKGTIVINGGEIGKTFYENYTTVKVAEGVTATVESYGNGKENTETVVKDGYTVYSFIHN